MKQQARSLAVLVAVVGFVLSFFAFVAPANAVGSFSNGLIADRAETRAEGTWEGQCKAFVTKVVKEASGNTISVAGGYQQAFANAGALEVSSANAIRGDIIQVTPAGSTDATAEALFNLSVPSKQLHTAIILSNNGGGNFWVIDSNSAGYPEKVHRHAWNPYSSAAGSIIKIWRLGQATGGSSSDADADGTPDGTDVLPSIAGPTNNRGVPVGSSRLSGDFNGDGMQDVAVFYDYTGGSLKLWLFPGNGTGGFGSPQMKWDSGPGNWWATALKPFVGDFNGDGITDIGAFYDFGSRTQLWTFTATTSGIGAPVAKWDSGVNSWWWASIQQVVGDFNGDGLTDIAAFYDYTGGSTKLWVFTSTGAGFNAPVMKWDSGAGNWGWQASKSVAGDFNGDGLTDIAAFYDYVGGQTKIWLFPATGAGNFGTPQMVWDSGPNSWWWSRLQPFVGDFNGDGSQDISVFYDYTAGSMKSWRFLGTGSGGFNTPTMVWDSGPGNWWLSDVKPIAGDFNGDSKTDIAALYNYGTRTKLWLFTSTSTTLGAPAMVWDSGPGNWTWKQIFLL